MFVFQEIDELLEPRFENQSPHLFQVVGEFSVVASAGVASGKRDEQFPIEFEVLDWGSGCDRVPILANQREIRPVFQFGKRFVEVVIVDVQRDEVLSVVPLNCRSNSS